VESCAAEAIMSLSETAVRHMTNQIPLCLHCHKPMVLSLLEPHPKYKKLDVHHFECECGASTEAVVPRYVGL
jgi:hypothetical protein